MKYHRNPTDIRRRVYSDLHASVRTTLNSSTKAECQVIAHIIHNAYVLGAQDQSRWENQGPF